MNICKCIVQYLCFIMLLYSYFPLMELQLKLCTHVEVVYYYENAHLLCYRSEHTSVSVIKYQVDLVTKLLHCKAIYAINLKPTNSAYMSRYTAVMYGLFSMYYVLNILFDYVKAYYHISPDPEMEQALILLTSNIPSYHLPCINVKIPDKP